MSEVLVINERGNVVVETERPREVLVLNSEAWKIEFTGVDGADLIEVGGEEQIVVDLAMAQINVQVQQHDVNIDLSCREPEILTICQQGPPGPPGVGGGDSEYVRETPMPITVGGATGGTTFDGTITEALDKILYPYIAPTFSSFALSGYSVLEVGAEIPAGDKTFVWSTTKPENIEADTLFLRNNSDNITLASNIANDGSEVVVFPSSLTRTSSGNKTFGISATDVQSTTISRSYSVNWYWRLYYGESASPALDEAAIEALRASMLTGTASRTYAMLGGGYKFIAHATALGLKSTFRDVDSGFAVAMEPPVTVTVTNAYGQTTDYYVYRTTNQLVGSINIAVS